MTTISETAAHHHRHTGIWQRTVRALGKLWATVITLPEAPSAAARREVPPSEYYIFPPY